ncbi:ribonuclease H-like domain-containing protein [Tanacetum coccineum]
MIRCRSEVEEAVRMISSTYSSKPLSRNCKAKNSPYGSRFDNRAKCLIAVDAFSLVANGRSQQQGIDCDWDITPVVKPATIRTVLSLAVSRQWPIHQLDVKNAFLHDHLTETVYMHQPPGFTDSAHSDYVCLLQKSLYGLKQAPRAWTPIDTEKKLGPEGSPVTDPTLYRSLAGSLQYLTFTRPDLSYAVQQLCLYMHDPREPHLNAMKRDTLSRSSAEAEYRGVANAVAETSWIRNLLRELHTPLFTATLVYCDNVSAVYMQLSLDRLLFAPPVLHPGQTLGNKWDAELDLMTTSRQLRLVLSTEDKEYYLEHPIPVALVAQPG